MKKRTNKKERVVKYGNVRENGRKRKKKIWNNKKNEKVKENKNKIGWHILIDFYTSSEKNNYTGEQYKLISS